MSARTKVFAIAAGFAIATVLLCVASDSPFSAALSAQSSCTAEMNRQDAVLRKFEADAKSEAGLPFAADDVRRIGLDRIKADLKGDPTADAAKEIKDRLDKMNDYMARGQKFRDILGRWLQCANAGRSSCFDEINKYDRDLIALDAKLAQAVGKWIDALENDSISKAKDRVDRARSIMRGLADNATNMATGAAAGAMNNCLRDFNQRVQAAQNTSTPVNATPPAKPVTRAGSGKGGVPTGLIIAGGVAAAGAAVAVGVAARATANQSTASSCGPNPDPCAAAGSGCTVAGNISGIVNWCICNGHSTYDRSAKVCR